MLLLSPIFLVKAFAYKRPDKFSKNYKLENRSKNNADELLVAVIDTGLDIHHSQLINSIYMNQGEMGFDEKGKDKRFNNKDDDNNGYIDDYQGWDFVNNSNLIIDNHGHGTHVTGLILHRIQSKTKVRILPIKYFDEKAPGEENLKNSLKAIEYAIQMKVDIINYSSGGSVYSFAERVLLRKAESLGIVIVSAAGNEGGNNDQRGFYPASYRLKNIISVAAVNSAGELLETSNYGKNNVDVAALGFEVESILPNERRAKMSGTSQATALVTAAFINYAMKNKSKRQLLEAKKQFLNSLNTNEKLLPLISGGKML